jgi:hypothetical protein
MRSRAGVAFLFVFTVACGASPQPAPTPSGPGTGGGGGSGGGTPNPNPPPPPPPTPPPTPQTFGCSAFVSCLKAAMSETDAKACEMKVSMSGGQLFGAVLQCAGDFCAGTSGGTARCKFATDGTAQNIDGTAAFDMNGMPTGDCGVCLLNADATLFGEACQPTTDPACTACTSQIAACTADKS